MTYCKDSVDRRKDKRFKVKDHTFVTINTQIGHILDISMGGLSFSYLDSVEWPYCRLEAAILFGDDFYLENVPIKIISKTIVESEFSTTLVVRQHGAQFGKFTPNQRSQLDYFIWKHTLQR